MRIFCIVLFCLTTVSSFSQETVTQETSPASFKWYQINTANFRVLYPKGFDTEAQRVANTLEHIREPEGKTLGITPEKYSVILHNQSSVSNGFVAATPRRSEFFTMPPQNYNFTGTNDWLTLLSSHEYRHMVQFRKSVTGFNKGIYFLFGQLAQAGMAFIAVPQWFWEGDAVVAETAFTQSGRGRIPRFDMIFRTNFLEGRNFGYHKQYLRSYQHNIPDHYVIGYHMVSYLREKTNNPNIWGDITRHAWNVPFIPFTFSNAIKKESGMYVRDLYKEVAADLKSKWTAEQKKLSLTPFNRLTVRKNSAYADYSFPQPLPNGDVVVLKSGIGTISQFVAIDSNGEEKKIFVPGPVNYAAMLSATGDKVVWNEFRMDPRWLTRSYSIVKGYKFNKKRKRRFISLRKGEAGYTYKGKEHLVVKRSRYAAAAISPDGNKIATIQTDVLSQTQLVILDYNTGRVVMTFANPENNFLSMPRWSTDGTYIALIVQKTDGKSLARYHVDSEVLETLIEVGNENVGHPVLHTSYLLYNSPLSGIDNIYALDISSKKRFQVTSSKYGAFNPAVSPDGKYIFYNDQSKDGLDVVKAPFDPSGWRLIESTGKTEGVYSEILSKQEGDSNLMSRIPSISYPAKRYRRASGMINPYSWGAYTNSSFNALDLGITSKDILSTTEINLGYRLDLIERTNLWRAYVSYQGLYPIIDAEVTYGNRSDKKNYVFNGRTNTVNFDWTETNWEAGLRIPLVTTRSAYLSNLSFGSSVGIVNVTDFRNGIDNSGRLVTVDSTEAILFRSYVDNGQLVFNHFSFKASRLLKRSKRDILSKWGQTLEIDLLATPYAGSDFNGNQLSVLAVLFFPGLLPHHSLWGYGGYQKTLVEQQTYNYFFRNQVPIPRGHSVSRFQDYYIVSGNYTFPVVYPDIALGPVLNIQRIRGNAFVDYAYGQSRSFGIDRNYTSIGGEVKLDVNIMRLLQQFNFGVRYSYAMETGSPHFEFIIGNIGF